MALIILKNLIEVILMALYPLKFTTIVQEKNLGGSRLKSLFHVDSDKPIGEYWVLSGHPSAKSIIANASLQARA